MDGVTVAAILKVVAEYGVLGLGWVAWILTMRYLQVERKRYQDLVIQIIEHFTAARESDAKLPDKHKNTLDKLLGK
jgi:hypothetical protein